MFFVEIGAVVVVALVAVFFIVVIVGARQEHPADLAEQRPTPLATVAGRVHGLHVRRDAPGQQPAPHFQRQRTVR
jgi:hypothetical protein